MALPPSGNKPSGTAPSIEGDQGGGGSKKDAAKYIENKTPKNASGSIKKALKLSKNIKKNTKKKNPKMQDAVGPSELASMLAEVAAAFSGGGQTQTKDSLCEQLQESLDGLRRALTFLQQASPQTAEITAAIAETKQEIDKIIAQMNIKGCQIKATPPVGQ
jgi:ABC-type transporter Mla subunit MlaD